MSRSARTVWTRCTPVQVALLAGLAYLPFVWPLFGGSYGTDIDITNILRSGERILDGHYRMSRPPGAFAHELTTGVLDRLGGVVLVGLGSAVAAVGALVALARIVERSHGPRAGRIAVVVVATQPWFWVAATSLGDYTYALALLLWGIDLAQRDARVWAGLSFALAVGFRPATALLVIAYLVAEVTGPRLSGPGDRHWRPVVVTGAVAGVVGALFSIPPWLSVGRSTEFLQNQFETGSLAVMVARWGVKNVAFFGVFTIVVLAVQAPAVAAVIGRFAESVLVRFALFGAIVAELVFLRFPWKPMHLLPMVVFLAILLAANPAVTGRLVAVVVASHLLLGVVSVQLARPDVADAATTGRLSFGVTWGVVVNEVQCRTDRDLGGGGWPDLDSVEADVAAAEAFACQARSWRAGGVPESPRLPSDPPR